MIKLANTLCLDDRSTPQQWLTKARNFYSPLLPTDQNINSVLKNNQELASALVPASQLTCRPGTIHSVKGLEFPAVCVVMTTATKGIIDLLTTDPIGTASEDARKLYVAASRAQNLLAIAVSKAQSGRLKTLLEQFGTITQTTQLS